MTKKRISYLKLGYEVTAIHIINSTSFLVGIPNKIFLLDCSNFNKMEIIDQIEIDGIPIAFDGEEEFYCAISRESRLGRWKRDRNGHNMILKLKLV